MRVLSLGLVLGLAVAGLACSSNNTSGDGLDPATEAHVNAVENGFTNPTGTVTAGTAAAIAANNQAFNDSKSIFDTVLVVGLSSACLTGSTADGSYNLSCVSGGKVTGSIQVVATAQAGDGSGSGTFEVTLQNACVNDVCASGTVIVKVAAANGIATATVVTSATVMDNGVATTVSVGARGTIGGGSLEGQVVYVDSNNNSFEVDAGVTAGVGAAFSVTGANGNYNCANLVGTNTCTNTSTGEVLH